MNSKKRLRSSGFAALFVPLILLSTPTTQAAAQGPPGQVVPAQGQMPSRSGVVVHRPFAPSGPDGAPTVPIDDANVSDSGAPQNETAIAVDPTDDSHLVGAANDYRLGDASCGFYNTSDGGDSWSARVLARPEIGATSVDYKAGGDPSVAVGPDGVAQVGCLYFTRDFLAPSAVVVHTVDFLPNFTPDTFDSTKVVEFTDVTVEDGKEYLFHDKPYITVDPNNASNVYVSWTIFRGHQEIVFSFLNLVSDEARIHFSRSTDGGLSFSGPLALSGVVAQGSVPAVGPGGEVYVVWQKFPENSTDDFDILLKKSTNGGVSFGALVTVVDGDTDNFIPISSPLPNGNYRVNSFPSIAVDTSGEPPHDGNVYVVYAAQNPSRSDAADIFLTLSTDLGNTWSTPSRVNDDATTNAQFFPGVSVGPDGKVNVVWSDRADDPNDEAIHLYADYSSTGGSSFAGNMQVSDFDFTPNNRDQFGGAFIGDYNGVASLADTILPLWTTLVVSRSGRNRVQDYEAFFDVVDTSISPPPLGGGDMHVGGLSGSSRNQGSRWRATVTIEVHGAGEAFVAKATVNGHWSAPGGADSCTTGPDGQCNVNLRRIASDVPDVTFTVDNVTHASLTYDSGDNHNPGSEITVSKPF